MAKPADLSSIGIMSAKGQARGVDPSTAVPPPAPPQAAPPPALPADEAPAGIENRAGGEARLPADYGSRLPAPMELSDRPLLTTRRASGKVPTKNIQTRLPEPIAEKLELMAFTERRSQQDIVSEAIMRALTEWQAQRDQM